MSDLRFALCVSLFTMTQEGSRDEAIVDAPVRVEFSKLVVDGQEK